MGRVGRCQITIAKADLGRARAFVWYHVQSLVKSGHKSMFYYFDESGDFRIPDTATTHKLAVVMGVAISEPIYDDLRARFCQFVKKLGASECVNGEPKGSRLTYDHRKD